MLLGHCLKITYNPKFGYTDMMAWSGELGLCTKEQPFAGHFDFNNITIRVTGGGDTLFPSKTETAVIKDLNVAKETSGAFVLSANGIAPYGTVGICEICGGSCELISTSEELAEVFVRHIDYTHRCLRVVSPQSLQIPQKFESELFAHFDFGESILMVNGEEGIFATVNAVGRISNLKVQYNQDATFNSVNGAGGVVHQNGGVLSKINVTYYGNLSLTHGGGIAYQNNGVIENSKVHVVAGTTFVRSGGIVYQNGASGSIRSCSALFPSVGTQNFQGFGGIACESYGDIVSCRAEFPKEGEKKIIGDTFGGLIGQQYSGKLDRSVAVVNIDSGTGNYVGGAIGKQEAVGDILVKDCFSEGESIKGAGYVAGFVSVSYGNTFQVSITNCASYINLVQSAGGTLGGFASHVKDMAFANCITTTNVVGDNHVGGFLGSINVENKYISFTDCKVYGNVQVRIVAGGFVGAGWTQYLTGEHLYLRCYVYSSSVIQTGTHGSVGDFAGDLSAAKFSIIDCGATDVTPKGAVGITSTPLPIITNFNNSLTRPSEIPKPSDATISAQLEFRGQTIGVSLDFLGLDGYEIQSLYISVTGQNADAYTQLVYNGRIMGSINAMLGGEKLPVGSENIICSGTFAFEYKAAPSQESHVNIRLVVSDGLQVKEFLIDRNGVVSGG